MNKVLIYQDQQTIKSCQLSAESAVSYIQTIFDSFKRIDIIVTAPQIETFRYQAKVNQGSGSVYTCDLSDIIRELLVSKHEQPNIAGLPLNKAKLKELIELPNLTELEQAFIELHKFVVFNNYKPDLIEVSDGTVKLVSNAYEQITEQYSYYAVTPIQIEVAEHLINVRDALNEFYGYMTEKRLHSISCMLPKIEGLIEVNQKYRVNEKYINDIKSYN